MRRPCSSPVARRCWAPLVAALIALVDAGALGRAIAADAGATSDVAAAPATSQEATSIEHVDPAEKTAVNPDERGVAPRLRPLLDLRAAVDPDARRVAGTAVWRLANPGDEPLRELLFWLYPNRFAEAPATLGDVNFHWFYPNGFSPGGMQITGARSGTTPLAFVTEASAAGPNTILRVRLPIPLAPHADVVVALDFATLVPVRLGGFGCVAGECQLMGGFYPLPVAFEATGFALRAPPDRFDFRARIAAAPRHDVVLAGVVSQPVSRATSPTNAVVAAADNASGVTLSVGHDLRTDEIAAGGRRLRFLHHGARPPSSEDEVLPYVREDRAGLVLATARQALELVATLGLAPDAPRAAPILTLVEAPLRHELVAVHGTVVLVSDRLFEIFPLDRVRKYHRLDLARAVISAALHAQIAAVEPDPDVDLSIEVIASLLGDLYATKRFRQLEFARDLLRPLAFLPAVDQLIYAPLLASSSSYFGDVVERDGTRDDVRAFSHARPGGRFIAAKLVDLLGVAGAARLARLVVVDRVPLRLAARRVFGAPLDWFWSEWLAPTPARVNYRLAAVKTTPLAPRGVHVIVDVAREGADLLEPVEVRVVDRADVPHELKWTARGGAHRFELDLPEGLASVEVDPRHRLTESAVGALGLADDPLTDNRTPRRWRLIYSGFGALLDVTSLQASLAAAVTLKPEHDLRNAFDLLISRTQATDVGAAASYERRFGRPADANRLQSGAGFGLSVQRPNATFGVAPGEAPQPGWRVSGNLLFEHDDRDYLIDPWRAVGLELGLGATLTALESGERLVQISGAAEFVRLFQLLPGHVLALDVQAAITAGDLRKRSQMFHLGGSTGLRGYAPGELLGRGRAVARLELRDRYVSDLDWNIAHFTSVRGFAGNLFVEAGMITSCDDLSVTKDDVFTDVGYTFRVLHDAFGVYQQLLAIDLAIPLNRHDRACLGQHSLGAPADGQPSLRRPPFVVLISFLPNF